MNSREKNSASFNLLHPRMQRWVYSEGWTSLHDAQERAIRPILEGEKDVIIAAATAAGKTEAAFLPILSRLVFDAESESEEAPDPWKSHDPWAPPAKPGASGVEVLYLSPLKALINDQHTRLDALCENIEMPVHRWHGDVSSSAKKKLLKEPSGVLLITPESLEATFVNRGSEVAGIFAGIKYIVVDEMHSFLGSARGAQLQSLMNRIELCVRRRVQRVGLSATLADMDVGAEFLRPGKPESVERIKSESDRAAISLQMRGYEIRAPVEHVAEESEGDVVAQISDHIFKTLRGTSNLVFANRRDDVELYSDRLRRLCESKRLPNEFVPHHGNLSKEMRESAEQMLKDKTRPATVICTSTLEMGIDVGEISAVAQVGVPFGMAPLRQRLGRSGRRGEPSVLRLYVTENEITSQSSTLDELRCSAVQASAIVELMLEHQLEPPEDPGFNYSTLIQQILSTIAQHGGATAQDLHRSLCGPGPFSLVGESQFARLLRAIAANDLIVQASDGLLLHGAKGESFVNHYDFYAAFQSGKEWRLVAGSKSLGTCDIQQPLYPGVLIIFAGRRWQVISVDPSALVVDLKPASGGKPPLFAAGDFLPVADIVRLRMREIYETGKPKDWHNTKAKEFIETGRDTYRRFGLAENAAIPIEN